MTLDIFPNEYPELTLDFRNARTLDPRITFSRASTATYVNDLGQVATADTDAPRLTSEGLLIEESRTNYNYPSNDFLDSRYTVSPDYTTSNQTAPDGSNDAVYFAETVGLDALYINPTPPTGNWATTATGSVYVKLIGSRQYFAIREVQAGSDFVRATFDLANESYKFVEGDLVNRTSYSADIQNVGNGWYRCSLTVTYPSATDIAMYFGPADTDTGGNKTNSGSGAPTNTALANSGMVLWGYQLEEGTFSTSLIPTSGAEVTRAADLCEITGADFSSWYNPSESTLVTEWYAFNQSMVVALNDGTSSKRILVDNSTDSSNETRIPHFLVGGSSTFIMWTDAPNLNTNLKDAFTMRDGDSSCATNGALYTSSSGQQSTVPTPITQLQFFDNHNGTKQASGYVQRLSYYPTRVPDSALQALTNPSA